MALQRFVKSLALIALSVLLFTPALFAQSTNAAISGRVSDQSGAAITGASINAVNLATNISYKTQTNGEGFYSVSVPPGDYRLLVTKDGFAQVVKPGIELHVQDNAGFNFTLHVGSVTQSVTVEGAGSIINTTDGSVSTVVGRNFVQNMPLNGRSFQSLILLAPGVVAVPGASVSNEGEFSVNGQRTDANYYTVDGVSANVGQYNVWQVGATPTETTLGTTQSMLSLGALQEFRINTSTYSAEYGRSPGAQISFESRSGTNAWHGSAFEYLRNDVLDANNWFNNYNGLPKTAERQNDFGGTLGGPVEIPGIYNGKNKTFFFFSYEGMRLTIPQPAITTVVPTLALRQSVPAVLQPIMNSFPLPNGQDQGNGFADFTSAYSTPSNMDSYSIRIDQDFGDKLRLFGRYADTPSNSISRNTQMLSSVTSNLGDAKTLTIGTTSLFTPRLSNEFRFNYSRNSSNGVYSQDNFGGATPITFAQAMPGFTPPEYTYWGASLDFAGYLGPFLGRAATPSSQYNVTDSVSTQIGSHMLKFGIDYRRQTGIEGAIQFYNSYDYASLNDLLANSATVFVLSDGATPVEGYFTNFSAYMQDEWQATNRLHLSLGLRWDINPAPSSNRKLVALTQINDLATTSVAPAGTPRYQTDYKGFAPRIGLAYQLHQSATHETVVRGGFGVFYDVGNDNAMFGTDNGYSSSASYSGVPFPISAAQQTLPSPNALAPPYGTLQGTDPHLTLPYTLQWNVALEQQLGRSQTLTLSYVASGGRKLLQTFLSAVPSTNSNFQPGSLIFLVANRSSSDYNSFQAQYQRQLSRGLQVLASYTWSHSIDDLSSNGNWSDGNGTQSALLRGNSSFDVRQNFNAALTYNIPGSYANPFAAALLKNWSVDLRQTARSALPFDPLYGYTILPNGQDVGQRPDVVPGVPFYLSDPTAPGGRIININAFTAPAGPNGDAPRNSLRGFAAWQTDLALQRRFPIRERLALQFRGEFFNIFNHPNFGQPWPNMDYNPAQFGQATSTLNNALGGLNPLFQMGGPRSIQFSLRLEF